MTLLIASVNILFQALKLAQKYQPIEVSAYVSVNHILLSYRALTIAIFLVNVEIQLLRKRLNIIWLNGKSSE